MLVYGGRHHATAPATTAPAPAVTTPPVPPPFGIAAVDAPAPGAYSARIVWTTTAPSTGSLRFGPSGTQPVLWSQAPQTRERHAVMLDGLAANTT